MSDESEPEEPDIADEYEQTPEGELKQQIQEENLGDDDYDYQQGYDYPKPESRDSKLMFFRDLIREMNPFKLTRVANSTFKEKKNTRNFLNISKYNQLWKCNIVAEYFENMAMVEAATSMGTKGFTQTNFTTQTRVVKRQSDRPAKTSDYSQPKKQGP